MDGIRIAADVLRGRENAWEAVHHRKRKRGMKTMKIALAIDFDQTLDVRPKDRR